MDRKKLDTIELMKIDNELNKVQTIKISQQYYVEIKPRISESTLNIIFEKFAKWLSNKEVQKLLENQKPMSYLLCFIVKENTDIFGDREYDDITLYNLFHALIENHIVDEIMNYVDKKDLIIVFDRMNNIMKTSKQIDKVINQIIKNKENKKK